MLKIKIFLLALIALVGLPQVSSAYFTTEQTATKIDEDTLLYTVTYRFGFLNRELQMPIGAVRGLEFGTTSPYAGYIIQDDEKNVETGGSAYSIVLSNAKVVGNEYYLPAGKSATFTLVTLLNLTPEMITPKDGDRDLSLLMTSLPFTMMKEGKAMPGRLNPSELQYYVTPELDIK